MKIHPAILFGLKSSAWLIGLGIVLAAFVGLQFSSVDAALHILKRVWLIAIATGIASSIGRLFTPVNAEGKLVGQDLASVGFIIGLLITGYVTDQRLTSSLDAQSTLPGEVLEVEGPTLSGQQLSLADYRGKIVLVDCWATWCGPCVAEMPNIKTLYDRFHTKGFEVIGVSFDHDRADLESFISTERLQWPQLFFENRENQGFENPIGKRYEVNAIPCTFLVDREGRLLARGLRGNQLHREVAKQFGQSATWRDRLIGPWDLFNWFAQAVLNSRWFLLLPITVGCSCAMVAIQKLVRRPGKTVGGIGADS